MIDRGCGLSLSRQCALLGVSRSSQYRPPAGESAENLALMRRLDELHLAHPFYGSRQMARHPRREGIVAGRHVLSWRLSNTMDAGFCIAALEAALRSGSPEIFNTDQGSQFTSIDFTGRVQATGARCSMDGRGRYLDNIFIERLWRSLKYEAVYLRELADGPAAEREIGDWFEFHNHARPHSSLDGRAPGEVYRDKCEKAA